MKLICWWLGTDSLTLWFNPPTSNKLWHVKLFFYRINGNTFDNSWIAFDKDRTTAMHAYNRIINLYGQPSEKKLTELVDNISKFTGIEIKID